MGWEMRFPFGESFVEVNWPDGCAPDVVTCPSAAVIDSSDVHHVVSRAVRSPIGCIPLPEMASGRRDAVLLVSDATRLCPTALLLPALLDALNEGGIPDSRIRVIVALGAHRAQTEKELRSIAGAAFERVSVENHSSLPENNVLLGTTSFGTPVRINRTVAAADLRIAVGNIEPHALVGLSGGGKALFPGVAAADSIERHHALSLRFKAVPGYADNPLHRDIDEACRFAPVHFLCNVVADSRRNVLAVFAEDCRQAHHAGSRFARSQFLVPVRRRSDIVIASCGGAPKDMQLYQAVKSLANAAGFTKPGGDILLIARCQELYGNSQLQAWTELHPDREAAVRQLQQSFVLGAHKLLGLHAVCSKFRVHLYSSVPDPIAELLGVHPVGDVQAWVDANVLPGVDAAALPCASLTFPLPPAAP